MTKLEQLIKQLCPDGVDYYNLEELFNIRNGYTPSKANKSYWTGGRIPWFRMDDIRKNGRILSDSIQHITPEAVKGKLFPENSIIIATTATIGEHALLTVDSLANQRFTFLTRKEGYINKLNAKFAFYYCYVLGKFCRNNINSASFSSVDMGKFRKFKFPLPPLPVQQEIVRILDTFTALTAELTAELTARKKQYTYYRDTLLTFGDDVPRVPLGEVCEFVRGNGLPKTDFTEVGVPAIHYGQIYTYYGTSTVDTLSFVSKQTAEKLKKVNTGDVIITNTSENLDDVGKAVLYLGEQQAVTGGHATIMKPSIRILGKYFVYFTQTEIFSKQKRKYAKGTKVIDVSASDMSKIKIPLPSLSEQACIVAILDQFDALTNDITQGLPAEIIARKQQYEYYRDKLFTFDKKE